MKTTRGRWTVDSDALILSFDNGHLMRIFTFPPGGSLTPAEALAWISGTNRPAWLADDDLRDLTRALADLFGCLPAFVQPQPWPRIESEGVRVPVSTPEPDAVARNR